MRNLSDTIARLARLREARARSEGSPGQDRLSDLAAFGSNPGGLRARFHVPDGLPKDAPLVVVLHGCTQTAAGYDHGSGWSDLADRQGFALLFPEQQRSNNANLCFNWFVPGDTRRGGGEALSIVQMVETLVAEHALDRSRVYVTGLSAGGAMTAVMLATYPDVFAGGAVIAGLPYGSASTVPEAFDRMRGHGVPTAPELAALLRAASDHAGPWPIVSIWHGSADHTVAPANGAALVAQWSAVHGLDEVPSRIEAVDGHEHRIWTDESGRTLVEVYEIGGMGHGTPLDTRGADGLGESGAYMLDVGISSTLHIARFFGLLSAEAQPGAVLAPRRPAPPARADADGTARPASGVAAVIEDALRAAGLMR
jgi:poly(hydroxyalkanoate) depolymerase family esterase